MIANVRFDFYSIVALHGLMGHAWNAFTTSSIIDQNAGRTKETNWLRDILPRLLEQKQQQQIHPRVMTYCYNADIWMTKSVAEIDVPVDNLLSYLATERNEVHKPLDDLELPNNLRIAGSGTPTVFIGHSLGGIVVKQVRLAPVHEVYTMICLLAIR